MKTLHVTLLGRFEALWAGQPIAGFEHAKARELFSYLLLHRGKPNCREIIANHLWGGHYTTEISKKYLRKALWQLNDSLSHCSDQIRDDLIIADSDWLELRPVDALWLDVSFVDDAYAAVKGMSGRQISDETAAVLSRVVALYRGELLEGAYQDWSFYELLRYRQVVMILLDKLMDFYMASGEYESVLEYGDEVLHLDSAREFTHVKLMRAYYLRGDRTGAIRQFNRCREVLRDELDLEPSHEATALFEQIRMDEVGDLSRSLDGNVPVTVNASRSSGLTGLELVIPKTSLTIDQQRRFEQLGVGY